MEHVRLGPKYCNIITWKAVDDTEPQSFPSKVGRTASSFFNAHSQAPAGAGSVYKHNLKLDPDKAGDDTEPQSFPRWDEKPVHSSMPIVKHPQGLGVCTNIS